VVFARFGNVAGVSMTHVPYKDGGITDIIGARVTGSFEPTATAIPMVQSGRLRAIAVTSAKRLDSLPDAPTVAETYPGFVAEGWLGLLAPRQTPAPILAKLAEESNKVIASPDFRARTLELGLRPAAGVALELELAVDLAVRAVSHRRELVRQRRVHVRVVAVVRR